MGHLLFVGFLLFFVAIIFGRIYYDYRCAIKKRKREQSCLVEIPIDGKRFCSKIPRRIFYFLLIPVFIIFFSWSCASLREKTEPDAEIIDWFLIDAILPVLTILTLAFLKSIRSYIYIHPEGFQYREIFRLKAYSRGEIEGVYSTAEFIFVKRKNHKIPIIIENGYGNHKSIYEMLNTLNEL